MNSAILFRSSYHRYLPGRYFLLPFAVGFVTFIALIALAVVFLAPFGINRAGSPLSALVVFPGLAFIWGLGRLSRRRYICALRLETDRKVFQREGGGALLQTLLKIQGLHLQQTETLESARFRSQISVWPKLSKRIRNLQEFKPQRSKDDFHRFETQWR